MSSNISLNYETMKYCMRCKEGRLLKEFYYKYKGHRYVGDVCKRHRYKNKGGLDSEDRNNLIKQMRKEGLSYQKIGEKFGLTRERIRQILGDLKFKTHKKPKIHNDSRKFLLILPPKMRMYLEWKRKKSGTYISELIRESIERTREYKKFLKNNY